MVAVKGRKEKKNKKDALREGKRKRIRSMPLVWSDIVEQEYDLIGSDESKIGFLKFSLSFLLIM